MFLYNKYINFDGLTIKYKKYVQNNFFLEKSEYTIQPGIIQPLRKPIEGHYKNNAFDVTYNEDALIFR